MARHRFAPGNKGGPGGPNPGSGRPSQLHRAACRKLVESLKIREFFGDVVSGEKIDVHVTVSGKKVQVPANIRNRLIAGTTLIEQGYGRAPSEVVVQLSKETIDNFEAKLLEIFQVHLPKSCPGCKTHLKMPAIVAQKIMELSKIFEQELDLAAHND